MRISDWSSDVCSSDLADRDLYQAAITGRFGITDRLEAEIKVPYIYRDDRISFIIPQIDPDAQLTQDVDGDGIGDVELALHYQINSGLDDWPTFIGNLRYKTPSGVGPFDVDRAANGLHGELATGAGFAGIEPRAQTPHQYDPPCLFSTFAHF